MEQIKEYVQEQIVRLTDELENMRGSRVLSDTLRCELEAWQALEKKANEDEEPVFYDEDQIITAAFNAMVNANQIENPTEKQAELIADVMDKSLRLTSFAVDRLYKDMFKQMKHEREQRKAAKKEDPTDEQ